MTRGKKYKESIITVLFVSLIVTAVMTFFISDYYRNVQFQMLGNFCEELFHEYPGEKQNILKLLKVQDLHGPTLETKNVLTDLGYRQVDFGISPVVIAVFDILCVAFAGAILFLAFVLWNRKTEARIRQMTEYLEKINTGGQGLIIEISDDKFSKLQDEIYKTITTLYQTREAALKAKENYADNLSNIAHQLKTPITAISLSAQMIKENPSYLYAEQIQKQLNRLTHLEEALLVLSRIDAGTLEIRKRETDVFTLLTLAEDNLQELFSRAEVNIEILEADAVEIVVDMDWTMEAIMNIMKNCMEHSPNGGTVYCSYEKNLLYVQIKIWDEGSGFEKDDLYHIFERFYRGKNATDNGIGIGLPMAKAIIEMENGIISASNRKSGGACFTIRFYSH